MVQFADPEVIVFAGGECLEKYGTLFKRTRPGDQELETVTAPEARYFRDSQNVIRAAAAGEVAVDWIDYDGTGRRPVVVLERDVDQLVEFSIPGGTPSDWELQELDGVTNLAGEYGVQVDVGDVLTATMPANWDVDNWALCGWFIPSFDYDDAAQHFVAELYLSSTAKVVIKKNVANLLKFEVWAGGVQNNPGNVSVAFTAGEPVFIGLRIDGAGTVTAYGGTAAGGALTTGSISSVPALTAGSYTAYLGASGSYGATDDVLEGALNLLVLADGSSADPITDRFNGGDGMAIEEWMNLYSDKLVLSVGGNAAGSAYELLTAEGAAPAVTRADTATQIDWQETVLAVASGVLRNKHRVTTPDLVSRRVTLTEPDFTNKRTTALASFTPVGCTITSDTEPDPMGGTDAIEITATAGAGLHQISVNPTTAIGPISGEVWLQPGTHDYGRLQLSNATDGNVNLKALNLTTGAVLVTGGTTGHAYRITVREDGWVRIQVHGSAQTIANSGIFVGLTDSAGGGSWTAAGTETLKIWSPNVFARYVGSESVLDASEVTTQDIYAEPIPAEWTPTGGFTLYGHIVNLWVPENASGNERILTVGRYSGTTPVGFAIRPASVGGDTRFRIATSTTANGNQLNAGAAGMEAIIGHRYEFRVTLEPDGTFSWGISEDGGAEVSASLPTLTWDSAFFPLQVILGNADTTGGLGANCGHIRWWADSDYTLTLDQCRTKTDPDLWVYRSGQRSELATVTATTASKGSAFPLLGGFGGPSGVADASIVTIAAQTDPIPYDAAIGTKIVELSTGPAGTSSRSYRFGLPGQLNGLVAGEWVSMAVGVYIPSGSGITASSVKVAAVDSVGETVGDAAVELGAWNELYVAHQVDAGATEAYLELRVHDGEALGTADEVLYFRTPTVVARKCQPRPYANAAEGTVSLSAEQIRIPFPYGPRAFSEGFTVYGKVLERGVFDGGEAQEQIFQIGRYDSTGSPRLIVRTLAGAGTRGSNTATADGDSVKSDGTAAPSLAEVYEFALRLFPDSSVQLLERVAGGVVLEGAQSGNVPEGPIPSSWSSNSGVVWLTFGGLLDGNTDGFQGLLAGKVVLGTDWTMDQLEAADAVVETAAA